MAEIDVATEHVCSNAAITLIDLINQKNINKKNLIKKFLKVHHHQLINQ